MRRLSLAPSLVAAVLACAGSEAGTETASADTDIGSDATTMSTGSACEALDGSPGCVDCALLDASPCAEFDLRDCPSYDASLQPVWDAYCVFCHVDGGVGSMLLLAGDSHSALVDVCANETGCPTKLVEPGAPRDSYLWRKLTGTHACTPGIGLGARMPPPDDGAQLLEPLLINIERWICCGAPP